MTARSLSRTAIARSLTFKLTAKNNKNRPISHRKTGGQSVFLFCQATQKIDKAAAKVAHLRATFGVFRGIGEGEISGCEARLMTTNSQQSGCWLSWQDRFGSYFVHTLRPILISRFPSCRSRLSLVVMLVVTRNGLFKPQNSYLTTRTTNYIYKRNI